MYIVPLPADPGRSYAPVYSHEAALHATRLIQEKGYAAIVPEAQARPEACVLLPVEEGSSREEALERTRLLGADLVAFMWIQRVEAPTEGLNEDHKAWGGFVLLDASGRELAGSRHRVISEDDSIPSSDFMKICEDGDPVGLPVVRKFAEWVVTTPGVLYEKVEELVK
jgi:hypothetical protein